MVIWRAYICYNHLWSATASFGWERRPPCSPLVTLKQSVANRYGLDFQQSQSDLQSYCPLRVIAQFLYAVPQAMSVYPGGYSITHNFLSDLGCAFTSSQSDNSASASIFNRSIIVLGFSLIPFFIVLPTELGKSRWVIRYSGVLSAMGLIGIGSTPYDQYFVEHFVALGLWIVPMLFVVVVLASIYQWHFCSG